MRFAMATDPNGPRASCGLVAYGERYDGEARSDQTSSRVGSFTATCARVQCLWMWTVTFSPGARLRLSRALRPSKPILTGMT